MEHSLALILVQLNFGLFLAGFAFALAKNFNLNILLVGLIYLAPLLPFGLTPENQDRFLIVSYFNTVFGAIELVIFVLTVRPADITFDRPYLMQLFGHTLPIAAALIGLSYYARGMQIPVGGGELTVSLGLFVLGSVLRIVAVAQIGRVAFKFDIAFRDNQALKTDQLYSWVRHPSYVAMLIVILAYAVNTHSWGAGILGMVTAWAGFQYRIHHEERALALQYGKEYARFRERTGMWFPRWFSDGF
jgi:protein-S-isoprenylcysteine O-methyltransferase Ste14